MQDLSYRLYIILCRLYTPAQIHEPQSIVWRTRRHSEVSIDYLMPHFATNKFTRHKELQ